MRRQYSKGDTFNMGRLHAAFEQRPIDRLEIPQQQLDLEGRERTNLFPWRGQFSPGLVELLLSEYASRGYRIFDPFAGVGTTLFEAARQGFHSVGTEINPAAVAMAASVRFVPLNRRERSDHIANAETLLYEKLGSGLPLFEKDGEGVNQSIKQRVVDVLTEADSPHVRSLITNALIRAMKSSSDLSLTSLHNGLHQHSEIVMRLPFSSQECKITQADARATGLDAQSVDCVITSPPYINVFNYHQNNRPAMELLGSDLLAVAQSEFGSNRKHRGNRFLTVIQYCLDLNAALDELRRVLKDSGRAILIVGRESNVRGVAFQNGSLVGSIAELNGFKLALRQERKFRNMFGEVIYEDILHLTPIRSGSVKGSARQLGIQALEEGLAVARNSEVTRDMEDAVSRAEEVRESPVFGAERSDSGERTGSDPLRGRSRSLIHDSEPVPTFSS